MANISTAYIRIARPDRSFIDPSERERLIEEVCQAYGRHGSYWVRIGATWRPDEGCFDLQYGNGKAMQTADYVLHREAFQHRFEVWERVADGGGFPDTIGRYDTTGWRPGRPCRYAFDAVRVQGDLAHPTGVAAAESEEGVVLDVSGTYEACNDRGFVDLGAEGTAYYGPGLQRDPSDFDPHAVRQGASVLQIDPPWLTPWLVGAQRPVGAFAIELLFAGRVVQRRAWEVQRHPREANENEALAWCSSGADGWDNTADSAFLAWRG